MLKAAVNQNCGYYNPKYIHEHKVKPEVEGLRPAICYIEHEVVDKARGVVEDITVHLAEGHDCLQRVAERVFADDEGGDGEAQRTPANLKKYAC
jgi:hypothetical protein